VVEGFVAAEIVDARVLAPDVEAVTLESLVARLNA